MLGIASSIGFGTGLHSFLLFLGPFIAKVTLLAYENHSLEFETHGAKAFHYVPDSISAMSTTITVWDIARKVRGECFFWGFGSALGELPPYFMARMARLAGENEEKEWRALDLFEQYSSTTSFSLLDRFRLLIHRFIKNFGFWGILLCASIPNPLFDLAGLTCGHFLIPFTTFFGATLIGKAIIKVSIQSLFIIILFSKDPMEAIMRYLERIAPTIHHLTTNILAAQKLRYKIAPELRARLLLDRSLISSIWNWFLYGLIIYFALSIVQSLARSHFKMLHEKEI